MSRITPVILCGGAGTRLWPLSTPATPKQFLALTGDLTMLQLTAQRVADRRGFEPPFVIASESHRETIEGQLAAVDVLPSQLILEPCGRGTAAAVALAALTAEPDALLLVMPSDHLIRSPERLHSAVDAAVPVVGQDWLATFGVPATAPETGFGYIRRGEQIAPGVSRAERFIEKPDPASAARMVADGRHDWNAGIFLLRAGAYLDQLGRHAPDILACAQASLAAARSDGPLLRPGAEAFRACRSESIDRAVMEKAERIAVIPVDMGWSDIGSWDSLFEASEKDDAGNAVTGHASLIGSRSCLVRSQGPRVVAIGVEDLIVVATGEAVLIVRRGESQRVREAVEPPPRAS